MSRIGKQIIVIPAGVEVTLTAAEVKVKGPKGTLLERIHPHVTITKDDEGLHVAVKDEEKKADRSLWGLYASLLQNMVDGVTKGFERKLELNGVGYKVALAGKGIKLDVGYSHSVQYDLPEGVTAVVEKNVITLSGASKQAVGQVASNIRKVRKPEPYKGKGIKYAEEVIRRKAGKTAKA
ncbi:MAG: 50S ribosomal protein L6 [Patescibacteria group bacterium]